MDSNNDVVEGAVELERVKQPQDDEFISRNIGMDPNSDSVELETVKQPQEDEFIGQEVVQETEGVEHVYAEETIEQNTIEIQGNHSLEDVGINPEDEQPNAQVRPYREQDIFLPIANVARIMKNSIPPNGKIAKEAKECVQECVSEFISFITSEAAERCQQEKRKTINGEDLLFALSTLGFDPYIEPLKLYLTKYRESIKGEKGMDPEMGEDGLHIGNSGSSAQIVQLQDSGAQHVIIQDIPDQNGFIFKQE